MLLPDPLGTDIFEGFDFLMAPRVYRRNLLLSKMLLGSLQKLSHDRKCTQDPTTLFSVEKLVCQCISNIISYYCPSLLLLILIFMMYLWVIMIGCSEFTCSTMVYDFIWDCNEKSKVKHTLWLIGKMCSLTIVLIDVN